MMKWRRIEKLKDDLEAARIGTIFWTFESGGRWRSGCAYLNVMHGFSDYYGHHSDFRKATHYVVMLDSPDKVGVEP